MKRAFLRKVKPVVNAPSISDATVEQQEQAPLGAKRRARTSAAMLGLALSMGATSLMVPHNTDSATAAEPKEDEAANPSVSQIAAVSSSSESIAEAPTSASMVDYVVQKGQTLRQIARKHQMSVEALAAANHLSVNAQLKVGQILKVPVLASAVTGAQVNFAKSARVSSAQAKSTSGELLASIDLAQLPTMQATSNVGQSSASLVTERNASLNRLRLESNKLKGSLAELKVGESNGSGAQKNQSHVSALTHGAAAAGQSLEQAQSAAIPSVVPQAVTPTAAAQSATGLGALTYHVRPGDTVGTIAQAHQVPPSELIAANRIADPDWIRVNQALTIPNQATAQSVVPSVTMSAEPAVPTSPVAASADSVALASPTAPAPAKQSSVIPPGVTAIPDQSTPVPASELTAYRVSPGDTLAEIARDHNIPQSLLASTNRLSDPNVIFVGQVLQLPSAQPVRADRPIALNNASASAAGMTQAGTSISTKQTDVRTSIPQQVSVAPLGEGILTPAAPAQTTVPGTGGTPIAPEATGANPYVQGLLAEVRVLREKHQTERVSATPRSTPVAMNSAPQPEAVARPVVTSTPLPQVITDRRNLSGNRIAQPLPAPMEKAQAAGQPAVGGANGSANLVAAAPMGSENYAPLLQPVTGRLVSPDLPPLPGAENFLPGEIFNGYMWPARGQLTSGYGWRWGRMHQGIDIAADIGTPVYAAADGVVESAGWNSGGYGNMIDIRHADGSVTRYAHLNAIFVQAGQRVSRGKQIAEMGSTGYSTGPHLHFEVHLPNQGTVNPIAYLPSSAR